jgi:hypothetical protein
LLSFELAPSPEDFRKRDQEQRHKHQRRVEVQSPRNLEAGSLLRVGVFFVAVAALAAAGLARRVGRIDPLIAMR